MAVRRQLPGDAPNSHAHTGVRCILEYAVTNPQERDKRTQRIARGCPICLYSWPSYIYRGANLFDTEAPIPESNGCSKGQKCSFYSITLQFLTMESPSKLDIRVLIVGGDDDTRTGLLKYFHPPRYKSTTVGDVDTALRYLSASPGYDVALLNGPLQEKNGFDLLETAQNLQIDTAFLFVTNRSCLTDKLHGFELGADDYVVRPCAMEELEARVHAVLRRGPSPASNGRATYTLDDLTIDFSANTCFRDDQRVPLTSLEFNILEYLVEHRGEVVPREELRDDVWADRAGVCLRTIDRHVTKIREKLEHNPEDPTLLQTVYDKGYQFTCAKNT